MDKAFANHWDKMNPTAQKQSCDHSRQLMEDEQHDGVLQILLDVIKDLIQHGVTPKEVEVAKGNCKGGSLIDLQSIDTLANYNGVAAVLKKDTVAFNDVYKTYIEPITYQQVNKIIQKYMIYSNLVVGIVHDHAIPKKKIESMCKQYID